MIPMREMHFTARPREEAERLRPDPERVGQRTGTCTGALDWSVLPAALAAHLQSGGHKSGHGRAANTHVGVLAPIAVSVIRSAGGSGMKTGQLVVGSWLAQY